MSAQKVVVIEDVANDDPHNFLGRDAAVGDVFYRCTLPTYGCIDYGDEVPLTEQPDEYPFFGFPKDAVVPA